MQSSPTVPDDAIKHKSDRASGGDAVAVRAVTVGGKTRDELYAFWRDLTNLARFMENIERIDRLDNDRSHWVVKGPAGQTVEWDARISEDEPGRRIAWISEEGAQVKNHGVVEFRDAPFGRGAEIHATIVYDPPGGAIGKLVAELFQKEPGVQAKRDLRRLKMLLETGEIATTQYPDAAPRYKKSDATDEARSAETR
ncbi:SRPBCC family protein [Caulobacter sp. S45]|uniref:SRPBCC family protein n=1 Tax=Caulobacter sp. S45 TaxID=1641861 RepID=UPI00131DE53E|nr:SRPBCC family protein [Caulobacter sp. S45]